MFALPAQKVKDRISLIQAALTGDENTVASWIKSGSDVNIADRDGWTALLGAASEGHTNIALMLVKAGANVDEQFKYGKAAMHWAAEWGRLELLQALLDAGADINKRDGDGRTPIMCAAFQDQTAAGEFFIENGASLALKEYKHGWTVLHGATRYGRMELVELLLEAGCDANVTDNKRWTPLIYAAEQGHTEAVLSLLSRGADVNAQSNDGFSALHFTRRSDIAAMLLDAQANPNLKNKDGNTPLHCAAKDGFAEVVRKMIDYGADKNATNARGKTAFQLTTYDKVKEVLTGQSSQGHSRGGAGHGASMPRYLRGTANVAGAPVSHPSAAASRAKLGSTINVHEVAHAPCASTSTSTSTSIGTSTSANQNAAHSGTDKANSPSVTPTTHSAAPSAPTTPKPSNITPSVPVTPTSVAQPATPVAAQTLIAAVQAPMHALPAAAVPHPAQPQPSPAKQHQHPQQPQQPPATHSTTQATSNSSTDHSKTPRQSQSVPSPVSAPAPAPTPAKPAEPLPDIPSLVKEAIKEGTKEWRRSKLSFVGEGRAGKTALTNSILGREFLETSSTVGINQLTCDVRQVQATGGGDSEPQWTVASRSERELETALAHIVAEQKRRHRLGQGRQKTRSAEDIRAFLREQEEDCRLERVDREAAQEFLFKRSDDPSVAQNHTKHAAATSVTSGEAWAPKGSSASASASTGTATVAGAWTPKKKVDYETLPSPVHANTSDPDIHGLGALGYGMNHLFAQHASTEARRSPKPTHDEAPALPSTLKDAPDENMVMKMLATMQDADTGLLISLFDFGGQSVFDVIHHLFLTRNGVYALVFNMEWLVRDGPEKEKALRFMRSWLSSVAVHTYDKTSKSTAPIAFVGTRLDIVNSPAKHAAISTLLYENFSDNIAWRSVLGNENGRDANGKAFQWFFPVDNRQGRKCPVMKSLMAAVQEAMEGGAYTRKEVPLAWFKVMDKMADAKQDCLTLTEVTAIGARCQVSAEEVPYLLAFLHDMGHLMWVDEPGLRDVVVLDPVSYLVTPATVIICKITPDQDDPTHHFMACHRECERVHKREWKQLKQEGVLNVALLPILWKDYLQHREVLLQLMVKFGLLVALRPSSTVKKGTGGRPLEVTQYLVPTLLTMTPINDSNVLRWTEAPFSSCYFVFSLVEELGQSTTITLGDLRSSGFLPGGMFERIVGKALSWSQDTSKGSGLSLQSVLLHKDMAVLSFGGQRFRLVNCADIHCVRVDVEGSNPLGIQAKLQDIIVRIIEECMRSLRCFGAVRYSSSSGAQDRVSPSDPLRKQLQPSELLIPLDQLRKAGKGESMLAWRGGRTLLSTEEVRTQYDQWLQLYELRSHYDVFLSYRWGPVDSDLTEALFDMFTNYVVGGNKRAVHVFLDRKRLQDGRRFKMDLASGLTHSLVVVPVVSVDALKRMLEHTAETIDNVLLEWIITLECFAARRVLKVFPVLLGARVTDLRNGGVKVMDFFVNGSHDRVPKIVPRATLAQCRDLMLANGVQPSPAFNTYTVHYVVNEMLQFMSCKASDFDPSLVAEAVVDKVVDMLRDCGEEALGMVDGVGVGAHGGAASPAGRVSPVPRPTPAPATTATVVAAAQPFNAAPKNLADLTVEEVCQLVDKAGFKPLVSVFRERQVTGVMLSYCEEVKDLQDEAFGVSNGALARGVLKQVKEWVANGVVL